MIERGRGRMQEIILGHLKPGWIKARRLGRVYVDLRGEGGAETSRPYFSLSHE